MTSPGKISPFWSVSPPSSLQVARLSQRHRLVDPTRALCGYGFVRQPNRPEVAGMNPRLEARLVAAASAVTRARVKASAWGMENIPQEGPFILACSHIAQLDVFVPMEAVHHLGRRPRFVAKGELARVPLLGPWFKAMGMQPADRRSGQALCIERESVHILQDGHPLVIWPEGTLTRDPLKWPMSFKHGMAEIALAASRCVGYEIPLIPSVTWGGTNVHWWKPWPRPHLLLAFGEPVCYGDLLGDPATWQGAGASTGSADSRDSSVPSGWPAMAAVEELGHRVRQKMEDLEVEARGERPPTAGMWDYRTESRVPRPPLSWRCP
ncbi:MAG: 1-acyl-sn-glycerol-3-phosphate acyltransferase [Aeriscardovia sp.]|nr:1-acyl-sn-glycerol-3-phosphate acyltransferase [Aeriscardovia sp.]